MVSFTCPTLKQSKRSLVEKIDFFTSFGHGKTSRTMMYPEVRREATDDAASARADDDHGGLCRRPQRATEQVGGAQRCLERTVEYVNIRYQFGRPVGSFQAVKHLLADMVVRAPFSGIALDHEEFAGRIIPGFNGVAGSGSTADCNGHGTHVAGPIGARDNGFGVVGMAPGNPLHIVKVFNDAGQRITLALPSECRGAFCQAIR